MRIIALLALCIAAVAAVAGNPQRIVGGTATTIGNYPYLAVILNEQAEGNYRLHCGGTIINNRSVLTAANCVWRRVVRRFRIRVGSTYYNRGGAVHDLSNFVVHYNYNAFTNDRDIAILRVSSAFSYNNNVRAGSIAGPNYNLGNDQVVWTAGWGSDSPNGAFSEGLRHVQIWTVHQDTCRANYGEIRWNITLNMLCAGRIDIGGRDQCTGDGGGPLLHQGVVVGVGSFGRDCALPRFPGVYTRVSRFTSWIQSYA